MSRGTAVRWGMKAALVGFCTQINRALPWGKADFCSSWPPVSLEPGSSALQEGWQRGRAPVWILLGLLISGRRIGKRFTCLITGMGLMSDSTQGEQGAGVVHRSVPFPPPASFLQGCCRDGMSVTVIPYPRPNSQKGARTSLKGSG